MARRPPKGFDNWSQYYRYRIARGEARGLSRSQARGHARPGEAPASKVAKRVHVVGRSGVQVVETTGTKEATRAARFDNDVERLRRGQLTYSDFDRRWGGRSIAGVKLPSGREVIALSFQGLANFSDFYAEGA
jgi:hypothetical protein